MATDRGTKLTSAYELTFFLQITACCPVENVSHSEVWKAIVLVCVSADLSPLLLNMGPSDEGETCSRSPLV
jgi:hypothetical protein